VIRIPEDVAFDDILSVVLSEIVNRQAVAISRAQQIHDSFLDIVLAGGGLADIVAKLGELVPAAAIIVVDDAGQVLAESRSGEARRLLSEGALRMARAGCASACWPRVNVGRARSRPATPTTCWRRCRPARCATATSWRCACQCHPGAPGVAWPQRPGIGAMNLAGCRLPIRPRAAHG